MAVLDAVLEMLESSKASFGADTEAEKAKAILDKAESAVTEAVNTGKYIYRGKESGRFIVDADMLKYEAMRYRIINEVYTTKQNMDNELATGGFVIKSSKRLDIGRLADPRGKKPPFKELFEMYAKEMGQRKLYFCPINVKTVIEQQNPLVKEAYEKLGVEGVRRLNYHPSNIRREILRQWKAADEAKVKVLLDKKFEWGKAYPCEDIKTELQSMYDSLGLQRTAKATDLGHWYDIQDKTYRQNGKNVSYKLIIRDKVKVLKESGK